ncbi:hypothetical protein ARHIZOSPH14_20710 [Agromyces rhizosphaerae]|uniref:Uncharacterized protein n=1 Tax=Agromyces rhizosphaerae TaxID=88374 RepID=A0A9W6CW12_9MICO|nr:hypothetical protein ARHIZOSPH14_20710 [Agromyces rhizosphaerae]
MARGWFVAASATLVASLSHVVGGGHPPGPLAIVLALTFSGLVCMVLVGAAPSLPRTAAGAVLSQLVLHALFTVTAPAGTGAVGATGAHAGHAPVDSAVFDAALAGLGVSSLDASPSMLVSHAVAAVLTIVALRHGDLALAALARSARTVLLPLLRLPAAALPVAVPRAPRAAWHRPLARPRLVVLSVLRHRGPPVASVA